MSQSLTISPTRTVDGREVPAPGTYTIDPSHSTVAFVARHLMIAKVRGGFQSFSGTIEVADDPTRSSVEVEIDASSITTGDDQRDGHLRSADFFEVASHPKITFRSTGVVPKGRRWAVTGDLTIRGITGPVTLDVGFEGAGVDPWGNLRLAVSAAGEVNREDWGLTWNQALEAGGVLVGKRVALDLSASAVRQT